MAVGGVGLGLVEMIEAIDDLRLVFLFSSETRTCFESE
jgi:hypothetical protein